jgi:glycosyltransferase involved in cell wall biosynthesis
VTAPRLSLVVTTFRETGVLAGTLPRIAAALRALGRPCEIVFVDDGSGDGTAEWVEAQAPSLSDLSPRLLRHAKNRGRGAALRTGFASARGLYAGYLDLDLEVDASYIAPVLEALDRGADVATGARTYVREGALPDLRTVLSVGYRGVSRAVLHHRLKDTETGFKFFRRERLVPLLPHLVEPGWFFDTEVMVVSEMAGRRIAEVPVLFRRRTDKESTVRLPRDVVRYLASLRRFARRRPRLAARLRALREAEAA